MVNYPDLTAGLPNSAMTCGISKGLKSGSPCPTVSAQRLLLTLLDTELPNKVASRPLVCRWTQSDVSKCPRKVKWLYPRPHGRSLRRKEG